MTIPQVEVLTATSEKPWARTTNLSHFQILELQKLQDNKGFKLLGLGVICYAKTDNTNIIPLIS